MSRLPALVSLGLAVLVSSLALAFTALPGAALTPGSLITWRCFYVTCHDLHDVVLTAPGDGWAVGDNGVILRLRDGRWTAFPSPTSLDLFGLWFNSPTSGWVVGGYEGNRVSLRWDGSTWTPVPFAPTGEQPPGSPNAPRAISSWQDQATWMVGQRGVAFELLEGRWIWRGRIVDKDLNALEMVGPNEAWALGGKNDGGHNTASEAAHLVDGQWYRVDMPTVNGYSVNFTDLDFISASEGWAVGEYYDASVQELRGAIFRYQAGAWSSEALPSTTPVYSIRMNANREGWAVGWRFGATGPVTTYLRYRNGQWSSVAQLASSYAPAALDLQGATGWAVGLTGLTLRLQNDIWTSTSIPTNNNLSSLAFNGEQGWAVGPNGLILRYSGGAWAQAASGATLPLNDIALAEDQGWIVGQRGTIMRLLPGQTEWEIITPAVTDQTLRSIALSSPNDGWAVGHQGTILQMQSGAWSVITPTTSLNLAGIALTGPRDGWAVGGNPVTTQSIILRMQNGVWTTVPSPTRQPLNDVTVVGNTGWAVGYNGVILQLINGVWRDIPSPTPNPLFAVYALSPDQAWAAGVYGTLLEYRNGRWTKLSAVGSQTILGLAPGPNGELWASGTYSAILRGFPVTPAIYLPLVQSNNAYPAPVMRAQRWWWE